MYVQHDDADTLELIAHAAWEDVDSYTFETIGLTSSTTDSFISVTDWPMIPGFYDLTVQAIAGSDTMNDTIRVWVINPADPICIDGKFNKAVFGSINDLDHPKESSDLEGVIIAPNPSSENLSVIFDKSIKGTDFELKIYSLNGNKVLDSVLERENPNVDVSHLSPGVYNVIIVGNGKTWHMKYLNK